MASKALPSPEVLRQLLRYEPETGKLFWKERAADGSMNARVRKIWNSKYSGNGAGSLDDTNGYIKVGVFGSKLYAHRIIWAITSGAYPVAEIDHINGDRTDNRLVNLRAVTRQGNSRNTKAHGKKSRGITGIWNIPETNHWRASITVDGLKIHLGVFDTMERAASVRKDAEMDYGFHPNHGRAS